MVPRPNLDGDSNLFSALVHSVEAYLPFPREQAVALTNSKKGGIVHFGNKLVFVHVKKQKLGGRERERERYLQQNHSNECQLESSQVTIFHKEAKAQKNQKAWPQSQLHTHTHTHSCQNMNCM